MVGLVVFFLEILAGVIAGCVLAVAHARDIGRTDEQLLSVVAFAVFGCALLAIPVGALRGRRRRRRWIEAVLLQGVLVLFFGIALATSRHMALSVWPFSVALLILALLLAGPVTDDEPIEQS